MAQPNLDDIVARVRRLDSSQLGRVTRVIDALEATPPPSRPFHALCGVLTQPEATAMMAAIAECERVDDGAW